MQAGLREGWLHVESEWEESEDFAVMVDATVEHEAMSGMVGIEITVLKAELESLLRRMQGMGANNHTSTMKFDRGLQELEAVHALSKRRQQRQCRYS